MTHCICDSFATIWTISIIFFVYIKLNMYWIVRGNSKWKIIYRKKGIMRSYRSWRKKSQMKLKSRAKKWGGIRERRWVLALSRMTGLYIHEFRLALCLSRSRGAHPLRGELKLFPWFLPCRLHYFSPLNINGHMLFGVMARAHKKVTTPRIIRDS